MKREDALARFVRYWEGLTPGTLAHLAEIYAEDAYFRDPFNEVRGIEPIRAVFEHMFETLHEPRFTILDRVADTGGAFLVWDFDFRIKSLKPGFARRIQGSSHVRFAPDGRVSYHRDYWDAAGELYAHLPLAGPLVRFLERRMKAK